MYDDFWDFVLFSAVVNHISMLYKKECWSVTRFVNTVVYSVVKMCQIFKPGIVIALFCLKEDWSVTRFVNTVVHSL